MDNFTPIETQEAFDNAIKGRLERNTKTVTEQVTKQFEGWLSPEDVEKDKEALNNKIAELSKELEGSKTTNADLSAKVKAYENSSAKMKIAHEVGLPFELAERLSGETEEDIRADAEKLVKYTARNPDTPKFISEKPDGNSTKAAYMDMLHNLNGGK